MNMIRRQCPLLLQAAGCLVHGQSNRDGTQLLAPLSRSRQKHHAFRLQPICLLRTQILLHHLHCLRPSLVVLAAPIAEPSVRRGCSHADVRTALAGAGPRPRGPRRGARARRSPRPRAVPGAPAARVPRGAAAVWPGLNRGPRCGPCPRKPVMHTPFSAPRHASAHMAPVRPATAPRRHSFHTPIINTTTPPRSQQQRRPGPGQGAAEVHVQDRRHVCAARVRQDQEPSGQGQHALLGAWSSARRAPVAHGGAR